MRCLSVVLALFATSFAMSAQNVQDAAADAAKAIIEAPEAQQNEKKPNYWTSSLKTNVNLGHTGLSNWAAGGDNTVSLAAFIDANANWKKNEMFWNNRLQLDYGFLYASSKPILQKNTDRIYLESKWGYKTEKMKNFYFSANYDFKSQFTTGYDYKTPGSVEGLLGKDLRDAWKDARVFKSAFLAPAYTNLALGIDCKPTKWLSINLAPLTGGFVIVKDMELREKYSMGLKKAYNEEHYDSLPENEKAAFEAAKNDKGANPAAYGAYLRGARFEFGAQLKTDAKVNVNDKFSYSTQVVVFVNYLDINHCPRINWDNRIDWKLAKYFSLTVTTNMIYDDQIMIFSDKDNLTKARIQFKESIAFGFTYTIASRK